MAKRILGLRADKFLGLIIVIGLIILFLLLAFSGIDIMGGMINANKWLYDKMGVAGVYLASFGISIIGNFWIILPTPYILSVMTTLITLPVNPIIMALVVGGGASIGELTAWLLGRGAVEVINEKKYEKKSRGMDVLIQKGWGSWLVFLYAATPLPDDILLIILGMEKFSLKKALIASFLGKVTMVLLLVLVVFILQNTFWGQIILYGFGLDITDSEVKSTGDPILSTITMIVTTTVTIAITTIDWKKVFKRRKQIKKGKA